MGRTLIMFLFLSLYSKAWSLVERERERSRQRRSTFTGFLPYNNGNPKQNTTDWPKTQTAKKTQERSSKREKKKTWVLGIVERETMLVFTFLWGER